MPSLRVIVFPNPSYILIWSSCLKKILHNWFLIWYQSVQAIFQNSISRVVHDKIEDFLHIPISKNLSRFVRGRNITEYVLLAQDIIFDIRTKEKHTNMVLKMDIIKAYDRVKWHFLIKVLEKMVFDNGEVDKIWRLIDKNLYSILINGQSPIFLTYNRSKARGSFISILIYSKVIF